MELRTILAGLEAEEEPRPALAWLAARRLGHGEEELRGTIRRALLLLAAGGDPRRALDPGGRAAGAVARDLPTPERGAVLVAALGELEAEAKGLPRLRAALAELRADEDAAWRWLGCALLAEELGGEAD